MKVKELIEILNQCDGESNIGTMSNNHWNDSSHYGSHGTISVVLRNEDIIIGASLHRTLRYNRTRSSYHGCQR